MGHIKLAAPVSHIWYFKGIPSRMGLVLDISPRNLEKVLYFAAYIVIDPGETEFVYKEVLTEQQYREAKDKYGNGFRAAMGAEAVRELGSWIGANGHRLVYGGSRSGLMGRLAHSVLTAGGEVTGVEPQFFIDSEVQYDGLTRLIVTQDMTERKTRMIELGDAFIAFPGGTGTLEEIAEVMSKVSLGHLDAPCILYDLDGYYAGLKALLAHMVEMGLSSPERQSGIYFVKNLDEIKSILKRA